MTTLKQKTYHQVKPFLKWAGGKRGLIKQLFDKFPTKFNNYHEPFLGGGAVFFELYSRGMLENKKIYLSDINSELINTYNVVKKQPKKLIENLKVYKKKHSKNFYYQIRALDREDDFKKISSLDRATRFIYLNKTCFNGLYRVNSKGHFNTPIGSYTNPNIADKETILNANKALKNAIISHQSFDKTPSDANQDDFIYLDPPYYPLTKTANFTAYNENTFLDEKQKQLFKTYKSLASLQCRVTQSNSDTHFINSLYKEYEKHAFVMASRNINSDINQRQKVKELIIRNYTNGNNKM